MKPFSSIKFTKYLELVKETSKYCSSGLFSCRKKYNFIICKYNENHFKFKHIFIKYKI